MPEDTPPKQNFLRKFVGNYLRTQDLMRARTANPTYDLDVALKRQTLEAQRWQMQELNTRRMLAIKQREAQSAIGRVLATSSFDDPDTYSQVLSIGAAAGLDDSFMKPITDRFEQAKRHKDAMAGVNAESAAALARANVIAEGSKERALIAGAASIRSAQIAASARGGTMSTEERSALSALNVAEANLAALGSLMQSLGGDKAYGPNRLPLRTVFRAKLVERNQLQKQYDTLFKAGADTAPEPAASPDEPADTDESPINLDSYHQWLQNDQ